MMRWLDILYAVYNISWNEETYTQIIFKKKIFSVWYKKKTHKKVNETQHCTTKPMLDFMKTVSQFHYVWCGNVKQMNIYNNKNSSRQYTVSTIKYEAFLNMK